MKVRMKVAAVGPAVGSAAVNPGGVVDLPDEIAKRYLASGEAEPVEDTPKKPKPETAAVDPALERAIKPRGKPRAKRGPRT